MSAPWVLDLIDLHAGGDVSRIVTGGVRPVPGDSVRARMEYLRDRGDGLRRLLLEEPYGIPEMSVDLLVEPTHPGAVAGYVIMEVMGYPIYSGSNTLCTATALLETGRVAKREGEQEFTLEAPAGPVAVSARVEQGRVVAVTCQGLPSYIDTCRATVEVPGLGWVAFSVAYSGGFYALVDAAELGFELVRAEERQLAEAAHAIVEAIRARAPFRHYSLGDVGPLAFLHFMGPLVAAGPGRWRSRSATYVHPGVICRSTTGTGTSARLALLREEGVIAPGDQLETVSLRETTFTGTFTGERRVEGRRVVDNTITGRAHVLARSRIVVDPQDPLVRAAELESILAGPRAG